MAQESECARRQRGSRAARPHSAKAINGTAGSGIGQSAYCASSSSNEKRTTVKDILNTVRFNVIRYTVFDFSV